MYGPGVARSLFPALLARQGAEVDPSPQEVAQYPTKVDTLHSSSVSTLWKTVSANLIQKGKEWNNLSLAQRAVSDRHPMGFLLSWARWELSLFAWWFTFGDGSRSDYIADPLVVAKMTSPRLHSLVVKASSRLCYTCIHAKAYNLSFLRLSFLLGSASTSLTALPATGWQDAAAEAADDGEMSECWVS